MENNALTSVTVVTAVITIKTPTLKPLKRKCSKKLNLMSPIKLLKDVTVKNLGVKKNIASASIKEYSVLPNVTALNAKMESLILIMMKKPPPIK